jgi:hypothetical protein
VVEMFYLTHIVPPRRDHTNRLEADPKTLAGGWLRKFFEDTYFLFSKLGGAGL